MAAAYRLWFETAEPNNPADFLPLLARFPNKRLDTITQTTINVDKCNSKMVKDRVEILKNRKNKSNDIETERSDNDPSKTILDLIIDIKSFKDNDVKYCRNITHIAYEIVGGGFDTSVTTMSWAILYLSQHPEVAQKCRAELNKAESQPIQEAKIDCPYFIGTIHEILRMSTISPGGIPHSTRCDTTIQGYHIPKDTMIIANLRQINYDEDNWSQPYQFRPDRFLRDDGLIDTRACNEITTFSSGTRRCPGDKVAITMIFVLLGTLIKRYDFEMVKPPIDMEPMPGILSKPKHHLVKFHLT